MVKVLIVDDDQAFVGIEKTYLEDRGYGVHDAASGEECLFTIKEVMPDIVLLDVMMPGLSGWDVCRSLKDDPETSHISVVMITARDNMADFHRSLAYAKADGYLTKPIRLPWLDMVIKKTLVQKEESQEVSP